MLTRCIYMTKSREVCIKARSPPASCKGQVTEQRTVKWYIPEIVYAFGPQLNAFVLLEFCLSIFAVSWSSLSEDRAEFSPALYR